MPVTPTYPGVYVEEIPSGVRTITGVSTSVTAFIGYAPRGPMNEPVQIFNFGDFEREFGGLHRDSEMSYAVKQFFLNGGTEAQIVRTADGEGTATVMLQEDVGGTDVLEVKAASAGEWGNHLRLEVDYDTTDPKNLFNLTVGEYEDPGELPVQVETFRNLSMKTDSPRFVKEVINEGSKLIHISQDDSNIGSNRPARTGTTGNVSSASDPSVDFISEMTKDADGTLSDPIDDSKVNSSDTIAVTIEQEGTDVSPPSPDNQFTLDADPTKLTLRELVDTLQKWLRTVPGLEEATIEVINRQLRVLANAEDPTTVLTFSNTSGSLARHVGLTDGEGAVQNVQQYWLGLETLSGGSPHQFGAEKGVEAGADGSRPGATELKGSRNDKTGIYALEDADIFNILCIPRTAALDGSKSMQVVAEALAYCEERRAFMIVDIPDEKAADEVEEVKTWVSDNSTTLRHDHAAFYFPRIRIADPLNEYRPRTVAASGTMAGLYARTDTERGVWKAPAGTEAVLRGVQSLDYKLSNPENGTLNQKGINGLRTFPVYGNVSWGGRTGRGADQLADEYKYIPVRRLALFIEESLFRGLQWVVFEGNDEPLWAQIRLNVGDFMHNLFRQGAFQGSSPSEAYFVKCDNETTTQTDINNGIVNILVGFAPLKPAEFVILKLQQMAGQEA